VFLSFRAFVIILERGYAESSSWIGPLAMHHEDHEEYEGRAAKFSHLFFVLFVVGEVLLDLCA